MFNAGAGAGGTKTFLYVYIHRLGAQKHDLIMNQNQFVHVIAMYLHYNCVIMVARAMKFAFLDEHI